MSVDQEPPRTSRPPALTFGGAIAACALGVGFVAVLSVGIGLAIRPAGLSDAARAGLDVLTHASVLVPALALAACLLVALDRVSIASRVLAPIVAATGLALAAVVLNFGNLRGSRLVYHEHHVTIVAGLQIAVGAAVASAALAVASAIRQGSPALRRLAGGAAIVAGVAGAAGFCAYGWQRGAIAALGAGSCVGFCLAWKRTASRAPALAWLLLAAGAAAIVADRRVLPGLYPALHRGLLGVAVLAPASGIALWIRARRPRVQATIAACAIGVFAIATLGGFRQRMAPDYGRIAALAPSLSGPLEQVLPLTERALAWFAPRTSPRSGPSEDWEASILGMVAPDAERRLVAEGFPGARDWNVILVSVDTVRADAVGYDGGAFGAVGGRSLSPRIDELARSSVVFERAYTSYPTSAWAYASMLTGLHPRITPTADAIERTEIEFPETTFVHRALDGAGWASAAVTALPAYWLGMPELMGRIKEGFRTFDAAATYAEADGARVVDRALRRIEEIQGGRFFLWVVLLDAHEPYDGPAPEGVEDGPAGRYLGDVAKVDREVGRLIDGLSARGLLDRSLLVLHSDHGEEFGEHGAFTHNSNLHEPQARVPLLIRAPELPPRRVASTVSLVDFTPTILSLLGVEDGVPRTGRSLVPLLLGREAEDGGIAYAEQIANPGGGVPRRAVWLGTLKAIRRLDLPVVSVFDLARDPGERDNLLGLDPARDSRLLGLMAAWDARIDRQWTAPGARSRDALDRFRARTRRLLDQIVHGPEDAAASFHELAASLVTPYLSVRPEAREALGTEGIADVLRRLIAAAPRIDEAKLAGLVGACGNAEFRGWLRERWDAGPRSEPRISYAIAQALAALGDDAGLSHLRGILNDPSTLRPDLVAIAVGRLGDDAGLPWIVEAILSGGTDILGLALPAAARLGMPDLRRAVIRRVRAEPDLPEGLALLAIDALASDPSDAATEALSSLALSRWASVATASRGALEPRLPAGAIEAEIAVARAESAALRMIEARRGDDAAAAILEAVPKSRLPRIHGRLLAATGLRLAGRGEDAERVAAEAESAATDPEDRRRAAFERRCAADPVVVPAGEIEARVELGKKPRDLAAEQCIVLRLVLTNQGSRCWPGGPGPFSFWLDLACLGADGQRRAPPGLFPYAVGWLPEPGMLPGEIRALDVVATVPPPAPGDRWVLTLRQRGGAPEGAVLASW